MDHSALVEQLKRAPVFRRLPLGELDRVLSLSQVQSFAPKTVLIEAGDPGAEVFVLLKGRVSIRGPLSSSEDRMIALRAAGEWVGEMALVDGMPRSARVVAEEEVEALRLSREAFLALASSSEATLDLLRTVSQRLRESETHHVEALRDKGAQDDPEAKLDGSGARTLPAPDPGDIDGFIGSSAVARAVREAARVASSSALPVMLVGETGTGKELLARAIHRASARAQHAFVPVNSGILSESLLESELFGHARGAFTGAVAARLGLVEAADGGTLLLDELGDMPPGVQVALLRFLDSGEYRRVGETRVRRSEVRVLAAMSIDPEEAVAGELLRGDLRFRLDVVRIDLPPLRERREDVPELVAHLADEVAARQSGRPLAFAAEALAALCECDFPGNVRELRNEVERLHAKLPAAARVEASDLRVTSSRALPPEGSYAEAVRAFKVRTLREALDSSGGNMTRAARRLGLHRPNLSRMIRSLGIEP